MQLETLRTAAGWSRQFVADQIGVSRQIVWCWETGRKIPSAIKAIQIAKLFGVTVEDLMKGVESDKDG